MLKHPFKGIGEPSGELIMTIFFIITIAGIVHSLREAKNFKRFPMSTNVQGTVFQVIAILALLIPKIFLIGKAISYAPYCYLGVIVFEFLLISVYNYAIFRSFEFFNSTSTAMIIPAFYQTPSNAKKAYTTKIWKVRTYLGSYASTPHAGFLYLLIAILVHTPTVVVVQSISFFNIFAAHFPLWWMTEKWSFWTILGMYMVGFLVHLPLAILYYHYGHNWRLIIKTKHAKNLYLRNRIIGKMLKQSSVEKNKTSKNKNKNCRVESFELGVEPSIIN